MAGIEVTFNAAPVATGTGVLSLLVITAAAQQRAILRELQISSSGTTVTNNPTLVEVLRTTAAGTGTTLAGKKVDISADETLQTTAKEIMTVEPTIAAGDVRLSFYIQHGGSYTWRGALPIKGGEGIAIRTTNTGGTTHTVVPRAIIEE
jgi:hypothetical protein